MGQKEAIDKVTPGIGRAADIFNLKTSVEAAKTKKPLTTETQRHREKHENQLFLKSFLCVSVVNDFKFIAPDSPIG
jgi:hypothetical protein